MGEYSILIISELFNLFVFFKINNTIKIIIIMKIIEPKIIITSVVVPKEESSDLFSSSLFDLFSPLFVLFLLFDLLSSLSDLSSSLSSGTSEEESL